MAPYNPASDIRDLIQTNEYVDSDIPIYIGSMPVEPDKCVILFNNPGPAADPKLLLEYPELQMRVRAQTYEEAYEILYRLYDSLLGHSPVVLSTTLYTGIWAQTSIFELLRDTNERIVLACNMRMVVEPNSSVNRRSLEDVSAFDEVMQGVIVSLGGAYATSTYLDLFDRAVNIDYVNSGYGPV